MTDATQTPADIVAAETAAATKLAAYIGELVVDADTLEIASAELIDIATRRRKLDEKRKELTRPLDASKAGIIALFKVPDEHLENAENTLRRAITAYQTSERNRIEALRRAEEQRLADERARASREAEEARKVLEAAQKVEDTAATPEAREAAQAATDQAADAATAAEHRLDRAEVAPISAPTVASAGRAKGLASTENWRFELTSLEALILAAADGLRANPPNKTLAAYLVANDRAIGSTVKNLKRAAIDTIPGVRVYSEAGLAVRGRRA